MIITYKKITTPKYPNIKIKLSGIKNNPAHIIGTCCKVARKNSIYEGEIRKFTNEGIKSSNDKLIIICRKWFYIY